MTTFCHAHLSAIGLKAQKLIAQGNALWLMPRLSFAL